MIARFIVIAALLLFAVTTAPLASLTAQTPSAAAHKQDQARAKFKELTERMAKLMPELQKTEPESSSLLKAGLTFAQEKSCGSASTTAATCCARSAGTSRWSC